MSHVLLSWEDFRRNPDKYRQHRELGFNIVSNAGTALKGMMQGMEHEICGFRAKSLEEVERIAASQGIPIEDLDYRPQVIPQAGHKCDILVKWVPRYQREARDAW